MALAVGCAIVLSVGTACALAGTAPTLSLLRRLYVEPAMTCLAEARWQSVPGLRMTQDDKEMVPDIALAAIFALVADKFPSDNDVNVYTTFRWEYRPRLPGRRCREVTWPQICVWLDERSPREPLLEIGPISYRPTHLVVSASYWPYYGHLGVSIDYQCERSSSSWSCWELSRYAVNWPRE